MARLDQATRTVTLCPSLVKAFSESHDDCPAIFLPATILMYADVTPRGIKTGVMALFFLNRMNERNLPQMLKTI